MSLTFGRSALRGMERPASLDRIWLVAGIGILVLSSCTLLRTEEALAIATALLVLLVAAADLRTGFLVFIGLSCFLPVTWGIDLAEWMPYLSAERLCCIVLAVLFLFQCKGVCDTPRVRRVAWFVLILITVRILGAVACNDPLGSVKNTFAEVVELYVPFLMAAHLFRTKAQIRTLVLIVVVTACVISVLAIIEHALDHNLYTGFVSLRPEIQETVTRATEQVAHRGDERRVRVAFNHSIVLGMHMMCVLLLLAYPLRQRGTLWRILSFVSLPLIALALLYTYSRGPMLGLACGFLWFGLIARGSRLLVFLIVICSLGMYFAMPASSRAVLDETISTSTDLDSGISMGGGTVRARVMLLEAGMQLSQKNLWFGLGPSVMQQSTVRQDEDHSVKFDSVDNLYLATLLAHGAIVLVLTVALYLYLLGIFTRTALRAKAPEIALMAAIASSMCVGYFIALTTVGYYLVLFWVLLGPALRACDLDQPEAPRLPRRPRRPVSDRSGFRSLPRPQPDRGRREVLANL